MKSQCLIPIVLIMLISLFSYINIFDNEFVWDDHIFILENQDIRSFSNIMLFFSEDFDGLYRPLRSLHYTVVYSIAGKNEFLYHFNAFFFHTAISILIFLIILKLVENRNIAMVSAFIFAAHPIHTARVTNMTAGFDLLGIFFMLSSFYCYIKHSKENVKGCFFVSLFLFLLAVFASEEAITLPLIIILYEFTFNKETFIKKLKNDIIAKYLGYFLIALLYIAVRILIIGFRGRVEEYLAGNFFFTMLTMLKVYVNYIWLLIFPVNLTLFHEVSPVKGIFDLKMILSFLVLIIIFVVWIKNHKNKIMFFSISWFFVTLIPFSNIAPIQVFMAERYLYVPSIGFSLLLSHGLFSVYKIKSRISQKLVKGAIIAIIILLLGFYIAKTIDRNNDWQDNLTLWSKTVLTNPNNSRAHDNLGFTYDHMRQDEKALEEFEKAVYLQQDNFRALANLGIAYAKVNRYNDSLIMLQKSIDIRPYHKTYDKIGLVYSKLGQDEKAIGQFEKAIGLEPRYAKAHNDLASAYASIGKFDLALQSFNDATRIDPDYADAHYNLGILLEFLGQDELAQKEFQIAFELEPKNSLYRKKIR